MVKHQVIWSCELQKTPEKENQKEIRHRTEYCLKTKTVSQQILPFCYTTMVQLKVLQVLIWLYRLLYLIFNIQYSLKDLWLNKKQYIGEHTSKGPRNLLWERFEPSHLSAHPPLWLYVQHVFHHCWGQPEIYWCWQKGPYCLTPFLDCPLRLGAASVTQQKLNYSFSRKTCAI